MTLLANNKGHTLWLVSLWNAGNSYSIYYRIQFLFEVYNLLIKYKVSQVFILKRGKGGVGGDDGERRGRSGEEEWEGVRRGGREGERGWYLGACTGSESPTHEYDDPPGHPLLHHLPGQAGLPGVRQGEALAN